MAAPAIPEPGAVVELDVPGVLAHLETVDSIEEADEFRLRAQALAGYLAKRDPTPANRIARMAEVRIGELLGPAMQGRHLSSDRDRMIAEDDRPLFRLMAEYRAVVEQVAHLSRDGVLKLIEEVRQREQQRDEQVKAETKRHKQMLANLRKANVDAPPPPSDVVIPLPPAPPVDALVRAVPSTAPRREPEVDATLSRARKAANLAKEMLANPPVISSREDADLMVAALIETLNHLLAAVAGWSAALPLTSATNLRSVPDE